MKTITKIRNDMRKVVCSQRCPVCNRIFMFENFEDGMCHECKQYSEIITPTDEVDTDFSYLRRGHLYGTDPQKIYQELCKAYAWDTKKHIGIAWDNQMYMRFNVDERVDLWFVNNPVFDHRKIDESLEEHHFVDCVTDGGLHICEIFENKHGSNYFSRNKIITFVKTSNGYVFVGIYSVQYNCADCKTVRNYYWRVVDHFPI